MSPDDFRNLRTRLGLTQAQLAEHLMMAVNTVKQLESGRRRITERTAAQVRQIKETVQ